MSKNTVEIRQNFLDFFLSKGHQIIPSSSLVPDNDPTLLFTNAGMNQFKDIFLGIKNESQSRLVTSQRCVRAGGKHNDLEKVGYDERYHTFFEMLGNFSFGDYFKKEAIYYAGELLTSKDWFNLPKNRLLISVYKDDNETYEIWEKDIGISSERIIRVGNGKGKIYNSDNFWQMGDTGPCGPCTEIFYDRGDCFCSGFPVSNEKKGDRYIEIWNIVFMQFNRQIDGSIEPLPKPSVDTGMGLERIATVIQNVNSNYDIDLFRKLIVLIAKSVGAKDLNNKSLRVIADHIRSCTFLIADGVIPSNEKRGYVLRRIIRRAVLHGNMLGIKDIFFYKLVSSLIEVMGEIAKHVKQQQLKIEQVLKLEEEQFIYTLKRGMSLLNKELANLRKNTLDGEIAFRLHDTYGFPIDLITDICRSRNIKINERKFNILMERQRLCARKFNTFRSNFKNIIYTEHISEFQGYDRLKSSGKVIALFADNKSVHSINTGQEASIILDKTPFYAESGGQIGDIGELKNNNFIFKVNDTQNYGRAIGHIGQLISGSIKIGDTVQSVVDKIYRTRICLNHSATHLMHSALRLVLGSYVKQKGSLVSDKVLRFDFSYINKTINLLEIYAIENLVNTQIRHNLPVKISILNLEEVKDKKNIVMLPDKQYAEEVRVLNIGNFSSELCKGTHVSYTGDIGLFRIVSEYKIAAGVHRIEAVTGELAIASLHEQNNQLYDISKLLKTNPKNIVTRLTHILEHNRNVEKELKQIKEQMILQKQIDLLSKIIEIKGAKLIISDITDIDEPKMLLTIAGKIKKQLSSVVIVLATIIKGKVYLIIEVSKNLVYQVKANELLDSIIQKIDGKGGGCSHTAQAKGTNVSALSLTLSNIKNILSAKLK